MPPCPEPHRPGALALALLGAVLAAGPPTAGAQTGSNILDTKHNLSASGPGTVRAGTETRVCVFCHTPHNATPLSPLWNRELEPQTYAVYASPTLRAGTLPQPSGPTKLCLSCHDGTVAAGAVLNPAGGISFPGGGTLPAGSLSNFGLDLSGHHPVSFRYRDALPDSELAPSPPEELTFGGNGELHCTTCHDPHDDRNGRFLVKDNRYSALCVTCHQITGWAASAHATSSAPVDGLLPRPPKSWPTYTRLGEWGCETCHTPHFAPTAEQLLNFTAAGPDPFSCADCHSSPPGSPHPAAISGGATVPLAGVARTRLRGAADIAGNMRKISAHQARPDALAVAGRRAKLAATGARGVACSDCHAPHAMNARPAEPPFASGLLQGVSGVDRHGVPIAIVTYEYEVCFKCHGDNAGDPEHVPRVVSSTNARLDFAPDNPSYHPVVERGRDASLPSIPSSLAPSMTASDLVYCSTCHADDDGESSGPHGSSFAPILSERYETADATPESYETYALCYRCHERRRILADESFRRKSPPRTTPSGGGHSGHLASGASCAACHDPHGVNPTVLGLGLDTGDHDHLINFDIRIVQPRAGAPFPVYRADGFNAGSCTLVCHGVDHDAASYP